MSGSAAGPLLAAGEALTGSGEGGVEVTLGLVLLLLAAGLVAGWLDAVVGGGGIIQLPALLLVPGITPVQALATNKVGSIAGTTVSAATYLRRVSPDKSAALPAAGLALVGAVLGAMLATVVPEAVFRPVILVVIVGVALFTLLKPSLGAEAMLRYPPDSKRHHATAWALGFCVGVYDGVLGPGTGSFLVIGFVALLGFSFLQASASGKVVNWATNLGALLFFVPAGHVVWPLGLAVAAGNIAGGWLGARTAIRLGSGFVRIVFIVVASLLVLTLGWDLLASVL
ncbi:TSUP family transporter [Brevibacterium album]|uniref:TSUP family transporter n=1 Tax=Brevibacterium album TaxID=417948 RepID=UPI000408848E|nr:TSUP family transporter [Brevibacterium album]